MDESRFFKSKNSRNLLKIRLSLKDLLLKKEQKVTEASKYNEELKSIPEEEKVLLNGGMNIKI